ncbi:MAG TPA: 30S ribosome-binding factor RbfA [Candidatus Desulfofervidus auxilii]|uniref:Ribosome-binding factor A n=1 Tax=Desulfofervidus auxilii TaxID=1621989 RepID=A0A7C0U3J4_DESA2|nr:30S ribosome-binding factor RbfA [Candidatus Desulfofervidus auxilii]HDD44525.1 30S ribosome-binding factor RbfA [Candidatus Desulfofervidus auxilii]
MKSYPRAFRIAEVFQRELADILLKKIADPRLQGVTITRVVVSEDLKLATIFFDVWDNKQKVERALKGFDSAHHFIKRELAKRVRLKFMPELRFEVEI